MPSLKAWAQPEAFLLGADKQPQMFAYTQFRWLFLVSAIPSSVPASSRAFGFQQGNSPRMLEKRGPFPALCGCSGSSSYYVCGEIQGEMAMSREGVAPQWAGQACHQLLLLQQNTYVSSTSL